MASAFADPFRKYHQLTRIQHTLIYSLISRAKPVVPRERQHHDLIVAGNNGNSGATIRADFIIVFFTTFSTLASSQTVGCRFADKLATMPNKTHPQA